MGTRILIILALSLLGIVTFGQTSTSFELTEHTFNQGGHPEGGVTLSSTSFQVSLDAVGEGLSLIDQNSTSFQVDSSLPNAYPPPEEVLNLGFSDTTTLNWDVEDSTGSYSMYRGNLVDLASGYGACNTGDLTTASTTDSSTPVSGQGFFYLITADNLLQEEGTLGVDSSSSERTNPGTCP